jgi:hypothetical protein
MKKLCVAMILMALAGLAFASNAQAAGVPLTLVQLPGTAVGSSATAVWVADLDASGLAFIDSIMIVDTSAGGGAGGVGELSGSDIDAIRIGSTLATDASVDLPAASVAIDFSLATFVPGTQRAPAAASLFNAPGGVVDLVASTLAAFDGTVPFFSGFFSMGDGGMYTLSLASIDPSVHRYLYIGEVTGNGETFEAFATPEPSTFLLAGLAGLGLFAIRRRVR